MQLTVATQAEDPPSHAMPGWSPDELGLGRAALMASAAVALLAAGLAVLAARFDVPPPSPPVAVRLIEPSASAMPPATPAEAGPPESTTAMPPTNTEETTPSIPVPMDIAPAPVPDPAPDFAPEAVPEPTPPLAAPSQIVLPAPRAAPPAPSRPVRPRSAARPRLAKPVERPLTSTTEPAPPAAEFQPAPVRAASSATPQAAPADTSSGLGPYRAALHRQIERNMLDDRAIQRLGISGTAVIEASIAADGRVLSVRLARSSGNRAIDQTALAAVQRGGFAAFGAHMPTAPITISVPIGVEAE